ncbi:MAG: dTDP-4-dehydrorhamnose reductase [Gammaproteobacteria bacterium]|nr:dTDP-4-dehydrorhamnose reductase [Gammaproteobacteria bacterium]MDH5593302.1 dTDP-4-dehydrorhamnose reductase [Gammaproteobacteria bacterium]
MKILIFGCSGQVGWELQRHLHSLGEVITFGREQADFSKPEKIRALVRKIKADIIVNAVAYTNVDKAESEEELATVINGITPGVLAEEASNGGSLLVHYSTDYVFDGEKTEPYTEIDIPNPVNAYGRSKILGEQEIQSSGADYLILRTSWIYASRGNNFLRTILRRATEQDELSIVNDQIGAPTWARLIAETTEHCLHISADERQNKIFTSGIYHLASAGDTSWYGFANKIIEHMQSWSDKKITIGNINPIKSTEYKKLVKRPMNSRLKTEKLEKKFGLVMPLWEDSLRLCMEEVVNSPSLCS